MNNQTNYRTLKDSVEAYTRAIRPTPQLIANLCAATVQTLADDTGDTAYIGLMGFRVTREPSAKARSLQA